MMRILKKITKVSKGCLSKFIDFCSWIKENTDSIILNSIKSLGILISTLMLYISSTVELSNYEWMCVLLITSVLSILSIKFYYKLIKEFLINKKNK